MSRVCDDDDDDDDDVRISLPLKVSRAAERRGPGRIPASQPARRGGGAGDRPTG